MVVIFNLCDKKKSSKQISPQKNRIADVSANKVNVTNRNFMIKVIDEATPKHLQTNSDIPEISSDTTVLIPSTIIGPYNKDKYFTTEDLEYYNTKYVDEKIVPKQHNEIE